jgi:cytochrome oxidase assembly protein ShyY1
VSHQPSNALLRVLRERCARKEFWIITLVALLLVAVAARLCSWQLDRAEQKQQLQAQLAQTAQLSAWGNAQVLQAAQPEGVARAGGDKAKVSHLAVEVQQLALGLPDVAWLYHPVRLQGQWLPAQTVYVANRQMRGQTGFWVYTPFALTNSGKLLWVQRGWVGRDLRARNLVPALATPSGQVLLQGQLQGQPSTLPSLGGQEGDERTSTGAALRLNLDWEAELAAAGGRVLPFTVREVEAAQADGLQRNWDAPPMGIAKHQGYAFQWAGLGLVLLGLYLWFQLLLPLRQLRQQRQTARAEP